MRKRLALLCSVFGSMFLLCIAVTGVAALADPRTLAVSVSVFLVGLLIIFVQYRSILAGTGKYLRSLGDEVHSLQTEASINHPLALFVVTRSGEIVWYNRRAESLFAEEDPQLYGRLIGEFIGEVDFRQPTPEKGFSVRLLGRMYSMYVNGYDSGEEQLYALYLVDDNDLKNYTDLYFKTRPAVMRIMVDNYDDLVQSAKESDKTPVLSEIDYQITQFVEKYGGVISQVEKDRYNAVFEDQYMQQIIQNRLDLLDTIRKIEISDRVPCTLSIGIGREAPSMAEADEMARQALEMAQGRGGDQAAVRTKNGYDFYGGLSKGVEKRTKVKTRIVAQALAELIASSKNVIIMGHRFADMDCFGAAVALHKAVTQMGKQAWIAIDPEKNMVELLYQHVRENGYRDYLKAPAELLDTVEEGTLLIVVDTHSKTIIESRELYEKCKNVAVIDHHRKLVEYIDNATIFYHEPYASSACEMVTELVQYFGGNIRLTRLEAEALLSGIMLDTKNFIVKAGVRTFEAAAYLRRLGAETADVRKLFSSSLDAYQQRSKLVAAAEVYRGCAIAGTNQPIDDINVVAAQAADELLNINGISASFVMYETGKGVNLSARSMGDMNVQIVMETLGGGGHLTMAGAQLSDCTLEAARQRLFDAIDDYISKNGKVQK
ncbi:MAG: DHH family phosphoesterase [Clostridiales bacterium]|nr:DHH family phosphoesterase [Clostridiales bacterium]